MCSLSIKSGDCRVLHTPLAYGFFTAQGGSIDLRGFSVELSSYGLFIGALRNRIIFLNVDKR